jgi:hypothetical protein
MLWLAVSPGTKELGTTQNKTAFFFLQSNVSQLTVLERITLKQKLALVAIARHR